MQIFEQIGGKDALPRRGKLVVHDVPALRVSSKMVVSHGSKNAGHEGLNSLE